MTDRRWTSALAVAAGVGGIIACGGSTRADGGGGSSGTSPAGSGGTPSSGGMTASGGSAGFSGSLGGALTGGSGGTAAAGAAGTGGSRVASLSDLGGTIHAWVVTRWWRNSGTDWPESPWEELPESDYEPFDVGYVYDARFSVDARELELTPVDFERFSLNGDDDPVVGQLSELDEQRAAYDLDTATTLAGGRFVVWVDGSSLAAECTLYGSGVPIIGSWRGELVAPVD